MLLQPGVIDTPIKDKVAAGADTTMSDLTNSEGLEPETVALYKQQIQEVS